MDGFCVRVGAMRCHSQALTFKLEEGLYPSAEASGWPPTTSWVKVVPNTREATIRPDPRGSGKANAHSSRRVQLAISRCSDLFTIWRWLLSGICQNFPWRRMLRICTGLIKGLYPARKTFVCALLILERRTTSLRHVVDGNGFTPDEGPGSPTKA